MWDLLNAKKLLVVLVRFKQGSISLKKITLSRLSYFMCNMKVF